MALHSNDVAYFPLASCKQLETFNDPFWRKCLKTLIFALNPPYFCFFRCVKKYGQNFGHNQRYFQKKSKIQKSVPWTFRYYIEEHPDENSASQLQFCRKNLHLREFEKIAIL